MRLRIAVALAFAVAVALPGTVGGADLVAEIATKGVRWLALPQSVDFEITYRLKDPKKARDLVVTCIVPFLSKQPGRGTLEESLVAVRGGLLGVGFGSNYGHSEFRAGQQGAIYTTMEVEVTGAEGTLPVHCEAPRLELQGIGRAIILMHKKDSPDKPLSNQVQVPMAADEASKEQLLRRYGPALEASPAGATPGATVARPEQPTVAPK